MYLSMWILADSIRGSAVDRHISSGEMCIRNASILYEAGKFKPNTVYISDAVDSRGTDLRDVICINKNDYFIVHNSDIEEVYDQIRNIIDDYEEWDLQIRNRIEEKCELQEVAEGAADVLHSMIGIMNAGFFIQAVAGKQYAKHIPDSDLNDLQIRAGLPLSHVTSYTDFLRDHLNEKQAYIFTEPIINSRFMTRNILINGWLWGYVFCSVDTEEIAESKKQLFQVFYSQILFWSERRGLMPERPEQNDVFMSLLTGSSPLSKEQLWEYLNRLGWAETDEKHVLVIREWYGNSLIYLRLIHQISQTYSHCYILEYKGTIVLVINSTFLPMDVLVPQLLQILSGSNIYIGISYPFRNLFHLPLYLEQANIALEDAQARKIPVSYCSDCVLSYTRDIIHKNHGVDLEHPVLKQIRKYDEIHGTPFYDTLRIYILEERSIQRSAAALNIHKNTLLYRLRRLSDLFPLNLSDRDERMRLILGFILYSGDA